MMSFPSWCRSDHGVSQIIAIGVVQVRNQSMEGLATYQIPVVS